MSILIYVYYTLVYSKLFTYLFCYTNNIVLRLQKHDGYFNKMLLTQLNV